jgi:hypothetical protein
MSNSNDLFIKFIKNNLGHEDLSIQVSLINKLINLFINNDEKEFKNLKKYIKYINKKSNAVRNARMGEFINQIKNQGNSIVNNILNFIDKAKENNKNYLYDNNFALSQNEIMPDYFFQLYQDNIDYFKIHFDNVKNFYNIVRKLIKVEESYNKNMRYLIQEYIEELEEESEEELEEESENQFFFSHNISYNSSYKKSSELMRNTENIEEKYIQDLFNIHSYILFNSIISFHRFIKIKKLFDFLTNDSLIKNQNNIKEIVTEKVFKLFIFSKKKDIKNFDKLQNNISEYLFQKK